MIARLLAWCLNPRCPWCGERTSNLEAHMQVEHAGDRIPYSLSDRGWGRP